MTESKAASTGRIFISYRREDAPGWSVALYNRLADRFGEQQIFKDVDNIGLGEDFVEKITTEVESCEILLALIGKGWLNATDEDGLRRLDNPDDFVRLEIEAAIERDVLLVPILVDEARMPRSDQLPGSISRLVRRQALVLSPTHFGRDTESLIRALESTLAALEQSEPESVTVPDLVSEPEQEPTPVPLPEPEPEPVPEPEAEPGSEMGPEPETEQQPDLEPKPEPEPEPKPEPEHEPKREPKPGPKPEPEPKPEPKSELEPKPNSELETELDSNLTNAAEPERPERRPRSDFVVPYSMMSSWAGLWSSLRRGSAGYSETRALRWLLGALVAALVLILAAIGFSGGF